MLPKSNIKNARTSVFSSTCGPQKIQAKIKTNMGWAAPTVVMAFDTSNFSTAENIKNNPNKKHKESIHLV
jgi:hypothetical protein